MQTLFVNINKRSTGSRTVPVLSCGADKQSFTVALAMKANGEKLPPKVIFKDVRQLNINTPPRMQISVHKKGWMEGEEGMFFPPKCLFQRRHFSSKRHDYQIQNEVRTIVLLSRISCYWARAVKHVCSTYANSVCLLFSWSHLVF